MAILEYLAVHDVARIAFYILAVLGGSTLLTTLIGSSLYAMSTVAYRRRWKTFTQGRE